MPGDVSRRTFINGAIAAAAPLLWTGRSSAQRSSRTRLIMLGTGGGPRPRKAAAASSQVILVNNVPYVIDCGDGVARQMASAGVSLSSLRHVFLTHQHSDHNADYGNLLWLAWVTGLQTRVDTWGPPPLAKMTELFFEMNAADINFRIADEGRKPIAPLVNVHELTTGGVVMQDDNVKVTAALVDHPPVTPAFAYRFDSADRSIVISGDTAPSDALIKLTQGADVLVHEALYLPAVDKIVASIPNATTMRQHLLASHTSAEDCGRIAQAAGVKTLVLSHLVPVDDPEVTDQVWIDLVRPRFKGTVIVAKDLMEIQPR